MKKKETPHLSFHGPCVKLSRDDLEEVFHILSSTCEEVQVSDDNYIYESLEEMESRQGKKIRSIILKGYRPYINFEISGKIRHVHLYTSGEEKTMAPYIKITSLLERRKRKVLHFLFSTGMPALYVPALVAIASYIGSLSPKFNRGYIKWPTVAFIVITLMAFNILVWQGTFSQIRLSRAAEYQSFWERNRDTIFVAVITALITALLTWLVTLMTSK